MSITNQSSLSFLKGPCLCNHVCILFYFWYPACFPSLSFWNRVSSCSPGYLELSRTCCVVEAGLKLAVPSLGLNFDPSTHVMLGILQTPVAPTLSDPVPSSGLHTCTGLRTSPTYAHVHTRVDHTSSARNAILYMLYEMIEVCLGPCTNCLKFYLNLSQNSLNSFLCVWNWSQQLKQLFLKM